MAASAVFGHTAGETEMTAEISGLKPSNRQSSQNWLQVCLHGQTQNLASACSRCSSFSLVQPFTPLFASAHALEAADQRAVTCSTPWSGITSRSDVVSRFGATTDAQVAVCRSRTCAFMLRLHLESPALGDLRRSTLSANWMARFRQLQAASQCASPLGSFRLMSAGLGAQRRPACRIRQESARLRPVT